MRLRAGLAIIASFFQMPEQAGKPFGEKAKDLTERQAARYASRLERRLYSGTRGMGPAELDRWSRQRRRARQTHPGKRGKRACP